MSTAARPPLAPEQLKTRALAELARTPFREPAWLRGGHAQTLYYHFTQPRSPAPLVEERLRTPDGDHLSVHRSAHVPGRPTLLVLHGLEGSARSGYVVELWRHARAAGWSYVVMVHRTCDGRLNSARRLYHSGITDDLAFTVGELLREDPTRPLYVCGVSLGGNQVGKWLGESAHEVPSAVRAAALVSPPFDLTVCGPTMDRALFGAYAHHFVASLRDKALAKERQYPGCIDVERVRRATTFAEFDTHATARLHGMRDAEDYWAKVSCGQFLARVATPTLVIAADNDPFTPRETLPHSASADSAWLVPAFTRGGGHVGFIEGSPWRPRRWAEAQVMRFFALHEAARRERA
jgi:uncharacterized protein